MFTEHTNIFFQTTEKSKLCLKKTRLRCMLLQKYVKTPLIIIIKLEGDTRTHVCSKVGRGITYNLIGLAVNKPIVKYQTIHSTLYLIVIFSSFNRRR